MNATKEDRLKPLQYNLTEFECGKSNEKRRIGFGTIIGIAGTALFVISGREAIKEEKEQKPTITIGDITTTLVSNIKEYTQNHRNPMYNEEGRYQQVIQDIQTFRNNIIQNNHQRPALESLIAETYTTESTLSFIHEGKIPKMYEEKMMQETIQQINRRTEMTQVSEPGMGLNRQGLWFGMVLLAVGAYMAIAGINRIKKYNYKIKRTNEAIEQIKTKQ